MWKRNEVSVIPAIKERSEIQEVCPPELHEGGKELQEGNISATSMTALFNAKVQTYTPWTLVPKRNSEGGTYKAAKGPKAPKVRPKVDETKQSKSVIGSQLIK
jgi:hypothetical protein